MLLAAGAGRRFGRPKALVRFGGRLLVERGAEALGEGGCTPVLVVLGAEADAVMASAALPVGTIVVRNAAWSSGMGSSVRCGIDAAAIHGADAALVLPVDQPMVPASLVQRLRRAWLGSEAPAVVATFDGDDRTPVVIDRALWPEVRRTAVGDTGARAAVRSAQGVMRVPCDDLGSALDVDTVDDLAALEQGVRALPPG